MKSTIVQTPQTVLGILMLSVAGAVNADYDALLHGADVSAQGHNPEWNMTLQGQTNKVSFTSAEIGTLNYKYPAMAPTVISEVNTTVFPVPNNSHVMNIEVEDVTCTDTATGKSHEVRVVVRLDDSDYVGCGDVSGR